MEKIIHQIWIGPYEIPNMEKYFISLIKEKNPDFKHILWTNDNLPELHPNIIERMNFFSQEENYALAADVLRIALIREFGGIYLDIDWQCHKGLQDLTLEKYDGFIGYHADYTSGNEVFGGSTKTGFIEHLYQKLLTSHPNESFMPWWFNNGLREYLNVINTWNKENFTSDEFKKHTLDFLDKAKQKEILALARHGEFDTIYFSHHALYSWEPTHKILFKEGNINYKEEYCKITGYNK
jgi:hypothetical protein